VDGSGRWRGSYAMAVLVALAALSPQLVLSTALLPSAGDMARDLRTSQTALQLVNGLSNAAFAVGVVVAAQLAQRYVQRRLFLGYSAGFVLGSVLAAAAPALPLLAVGRVVQGATTGLMMISALPPLVTRFGPDRLPWTVALVNVGLFGATTLGPMVGGVSAGASAWRTLLWVVTAVGVLTLAATVVGYPASDPPDPDLPVDRAAIGLATLATVLTFVASSLVATVAPTSPALWGPFACGFAALVALVVVEARAEQPLMPVRELATQLPVTGTLVATVAGAAFVTVVELVQVHLASVAHEDPAGAGLLTWPLPVGLVLASVSFGLLFRTRFVPVLVNVGLLALVAGCAVLLRLSPSGAEVVVPAASALLGFGAGATVTPGLFLAGLGVRSSRLGRAFALVQLLRLTVGFAVGPVVVQVARSQRSLADGVHLGVVLSLALCVVGLALSVLVPVLSGARLRTPDLRAWLEDGEQGVSSPRTMAGVRPGVDDPDARPVVPRPLRRGRR
jgi:MFS family permease